MTVGDAIVHGASRRLRPILMTALATIGALLPLGLGITGHGGFISQPLAIIVIGGLVSSTLLTLLVLPVLYYLVEGAAERRAQYPKLPMSIVTRVLAIGGGILVAAGLAAVGYSIANGLGKEALIPRLASLGSTIGLLALLAALIVWLVRSARNRRAHPVNAPTAQPVPGAGDSELVPTVDA